LEVTIMKAKESDTLELLNFELGFVEAGGYGRSVRTPWKPTSVFQDSLSCLNFGDPDRPHPCSECLLMDFVPVEHRSDDIPCHHIPLNEAGETVDQLEWEGDQRRLEEAVKGWLRTAILQLEEDSTKSGAV
jgi:hypothetical protein